jgi:hypothetical protein
MPVSRWCIYPATAFTCRVKCHHSGATGVCARRRATVGTSEPGFGEGTLADLVGEINAEVSAEGPDARRPRLAETLSDANAVVAS